MKEHTQKPPEFSLCGALAKSNVVINNAIYGVTATSPEADSAAAHKKGKPSTIVKIFPPVGENTTGRRVVYSCGDFWSDVITRAKYTWVDGIAEDQLLEQKVLRVADISMAPPKPDKRHPDPAMVAARAEYIAPTNAKELFALLVRTKGYQYI